MGMVRVKMWKGSGDEAWAELSTESKIRRRVGACRLIDRPVYEARVLKYQNISDQYSGFLRVADLCIVTVIFPMVRSFRQNPPSLSKYD